MRNDYYSESGLVCSQGAGGSFASQTVLILFIFVTFLGALFNILLLWELNPFK